jgi:TolB protein
MTKAPARTASETPTPKPAAAATPSVLNLGAVRPGNLVLPQVAVQFAGGDIGTRIQNDLLLADVAMAPTNADAAATAADKDKQLGTGVDYDAWTVAGVSYVVRGVASGEASAQAELFDIASRRRVLGQSYSAGGQGTARIASRIADDVMQAITGAPGIFSSRIAYLGDFSGGTKEVMVMDADGQNLRQLTSERALVASPAWGRLGQELFFTSYRDNNPDLYGITLDGRRFQVSRRPGMNTSPAWSEAAQRLAVMLSKDGNSEIYTMDANGSSLARLTRNGGEVADTAPDWSPDGTQIAYTSDDAGQPGIYIMNRDGTGSHRVTGGGYFDSVSWSPDGKRLAYVARESGEFNVYMLDLASNTPTRLTHSQGDNTDPSWGPNSRHLVFASTRGSGHNIYMMNTDTRVAKPITRSGNATSPVWGPILK